MDFARACPATSCAFTFMTAPEECTESSMDVLRLDANSEIQKAVEDAGEAASNNIIAAIAWMASGEAKRGEWGHFELHTDALSTLAKRNGALVYGLLGLVESVRASRN